LLWITPDQYYNSNEQKEESYWASEYVFINTETNLPYFDPFNVPAGIELVNIYDAPTYDNEVKYWYDVSEV